ncbi:MAG: DUF4250 domain-containing protein [Bacteroides sp.]|nr:DUF4250 domain-containing protein [Bacteroides sp.]
MLPKDPNMLLSIINMRLRDDNVTLPELCQRLDIDEGDLTRRLQEAGYRYQPESNRFI